MQSLEMALEWSLEHDWGAAQPPQSLEMTLVQPLDWSLEQDWVASDLLGLRIDLKGSSTKIVLD